MSETSELPDHPFRPTAMQITAKTQAILALLREINDLGNHPDAPKAVPIFVVDQSFAIIAFVMAMHEHMFPGELAAKGITT